MLKTKHLITSLLAIAAFSLLFLSSCKNGSDDEPLTAEEQRLLDLGGSSGVTWVATSITFQGAPATGFDNFSVTMRGTETSKTYTSTDADPLLNASGSWDFNGTNINQLVFDEDSDNVYSISNLITEATPATLTLTVNYTEPGGTIEGVNGTYVFNLQAQ